MDIDRPENVSFFDFVGGVQLLRGEDVRTVMPVILIGICVSGAVGNLLVLLIFIRDFRSGKGSEIKAFLTSLASTDLVILLLCAPVRAVTYYKQTWIMGSFVCRTTDWFQHSCVVAKTLILAVTTRSKHTLVSSTTTGPFYSPTWIHGALAFIWIVSMMFPIPQMLFATLLPHGNDIICVSEMPVCASDFMNLFYKVYPTVTFVVPVIFTLAYYTKTLHAAVNNAPSPLHQSKVTLVLLCLSGALGLMLLPEWGTFTWIRLGNNKPPVGFIIFAQVLLYACSAVSPVILMTMYDDVRQGLIAIWFIATCRASKHISSNNKCLKTEGNGAEVGANAVANAVSKPGDKTFPDVEHFWTGRRNTHVEEEQDPVPWEREEKMM
ncbi:probable G-protein coupled receptor 151 isoform X2 [Sphaeramia orbicularis]|uniref:probable G-protein coupled receptor 151 isoform X1 n=1 Tax=Sphaeramia orbicularis TaxID=375764 RepID=UPI00117F680B|nr:probable G-protein coupled receptor 151 isoform X1 [Sphaeramia orbicularis]XP_029983408.1 probable G-protein coupled receptor 151 isoform X2 [Sphaeramia orbicularis]